MNSSRILPPDHPKLRQKCRTVALRELKTNKLQNIVDEMLDIVYGGSNKGTNRDKSRPMTVGLSANQIGITMRISIVDLAIGKKDFNDIHVLVNPEIIRHSQAAFEHSEGCVNLPDIWGYVRRYKEIRVRSLDRSGNRLILELKGLPAVLLQHEIDHLNGKLFIDRLENPKKAHHVKNGEYQKYKRAKKSWSRYIDVSHLSRHQDL